MVPIYTRRRRSFHRERSKAQDLVMRPNPAKRSVHQGRERVPGLTGGIRAAFELCSNECSATWRNVAGPNRTSVV